MGRWLDALKKYENAPGAHCQNCQKSPEPIFVSFVSAATKADAKILPPGEDDAEERAAILEYEGGLSRWPQAAKAALPPPDRTDKTPSKSASTSAFPRHQPVMSVLSDTPAALSKSDAELYADMLRLQGYGSYGSIGVLLGWGMTRAANAETVLRVAGRLQYDNVGRGRLVESAQQTGDEKS